MLKVFMIDFVNIDVVSTGGKQKVSRRVSSVLSVDGDTSGYALSDTPGGARGCAASKEGGTKGSGDGTATGARAAASVIRKCALTPGTPGKCASKSQ